MAKKNKKKKPHYSEIDSAIYLVIIHVQRQYRYCTTEQDHAGWKAQCDSGSHAYNTGCDILQHYHYS